MLSYGFTRVLVEQVFLCPVQYTGVLSILRPNAKLRLFLIINDGDDKNYY